jgi:Tfp pilus assembly protein PilO
MLNRRKIDLLGGIAFLALFALFAWGVGKNALRPYLVAQRDMKSYTRAVRILSEAEAGVERLDAQVAEMSSMSTQVETLLPQTLNLDDFLMDMDALARKTGVRIETLAPEKLAERERYREMDLHVQVSGSFLSIYDLLLEIEEGKRLVEVRQITIQGDPALNRCVANMRLALCFAPEVKA